jgi:hypothetical protein
MDSISETSDTSTPNEFYTSLLKAIITYIHTHRQKLRLVIKNNASGIFTHTLQEIISAHILEYLTEFEQRGYKFNVPLPLLAHYRSGGMISVAYYLIANNTGYDISEIYDYMVHLVYESTAPVTENNLKKKH